MSAFSAAVRLERAWLALTDPVGEWDAVDRLPWHKALAFLVDGINRPRQVARPRARAFDERDLIRALGADPAARKGMLPCPAHEDRHPSLSWEVTRTGRALVRCHAGCSFDEIRRAVGR